MDASQYSQAKLLFNEVCELPKASQTERLHALTDDIALIEYVQALLAQTDTDHPRVAQSVLRGLSGIAGEVVKVGMTLGAWKLAEEIGQGGMGMVFLAQRVDGHFQQTAAIKLLHGIPSAKSLEYLTRERQILATLTHPNIARLYDGGATASGQPYLVMEYVEGVSIDRYSRDHKLGVKAILRLVTDVCSAVSFAHQRLIVHCDIKPSNILVTDSGRPMLLDFGIARLVDANAPLDTPVASNIEGGVSLTINTAPQASGTQTKARAFTPRYASPEQHAGLALTTATDIFSLGKMLEELLSNALETSENKAASDPNKGKKLDLELSAIIAKAVHEDPLKRYATVNALAADIARFQALEPVKAMPATGLYVARKFSQRHWPWLLAASFVAVGSVVAAMRITSERDRAQVAEVTALKERDATKLAQATALRERDGAQAARLSAERERDRTALAEAATAAQRDRAKQSEAFAVSERNRAMQAEAAAKQTSKFLISVFENAGPTAASGDVTAAALLDRAEKQLEKDLKDQPQVQARLYTTLGTVQRGMGAYLKAERLHARAIGLEKQTLAKDVKLSASDEKQRRAALELADKLFTQANDLYVNGKGTAAMMPAREALALREKNAAADAVALGESLSQVGHMLVFARKLDEGKPLLERGLSIVEKADPQGVATAYALGNLSWQRFKAGDLVGAEAMSRRALDLRVKQGGSAEAPYAIKQRQDLARIIEGAGRIDEAQALFQQTLVSRTALHGHDNIRVAIGLRRLGLSLVKQDRALEALPKYTEALAIVVKTEQKESPHYQTMNANLGMAYIQLGDYEAAAVALQQSAQYARKLAFLGWQDKLISYLNLLAFASTKLGRFDDAAAQLDEALNISLKTNDDKSVNTISTLVHMVDLASASGNFDEAATRLAQLETLQKDTTLPSNLAAMLAHARARSATHKGDVAGALQAFDVAEQYWTNFYGKNTSAAWLAKTPRAQWLAAKGNPLQRAEGVDLAQQILVQLTPKLEKDAAVLMQLNQLVAAQ